MEHLRDIQHRSSPVIQQQHPLAAPEWPGGMLDELPLLVTPMPSRSIIHSDAMALALRDIDASVPAAPIWHNSLGQASGNLHLTTFAGTLIGDTKTDNRLSGALSLLSSSLAPVPDAVLFEILPFRHTENPDSIFDLSFPVQEAEYNSQGPISLHQISEDDSATLATSKSLSSKEREYEQLLTSLKDNHGSAHPLVLEFALQASTQLMLENCHKYVSATLWQLADARRLITQSLDETTIDAVSILLPIFRTEGQDPNWSQFLTLLIDFFFKISQKIDSAIYERVTHLRDELSEIEKVRKRAEGHKQVHKRHRIGMAARSHIRYLSSICLAVDDLVISAIAAALITRGFRLEAREVKPTKDITLAGDLSLPKKVTDGFNFFTTNDLEFSILY